MDAFQDLLSRLQSSVDDLTDLLRNVQNFPQRTGRALTGTISAGDTVVTLAHGLGRPYKGAQVQWAVDLLSPLSALPPGPSSAQTVSFVLGVAQGSDVAFSVLVY